MAASKLWGHLVTHYRRVDEGGYDEDEPICKWYDCTYSTKSDSTG